MPVDTAQVPPLPYRVRTPQVLLGVGAVLLVSAGAAVASAYGGGPARAVVAALALACGWFSVRAAQRELPSSQEVLAGCAAGLALAASDLGSESGGGTGVTASLLALVFLLLRLIAPTTAAWPLAAWGAVLLAVLRTLDDIPPGAHTEVFLAVSLAGLAVSLRGRPVVARIALATTTPWWLVAVAEASRQAWAAEGGSAWWSALLVAAATGGLLLVRRRDAVAPLLGPPRLVPRVAGLVAGTAFSGALSAAGTAGLVLGGYAGVLIATAAPQLLPEQHRDPFASVTRWAGSVLAVLAIAQLAGRGDWPALALLLLLTALGTAWFAARHPDERPVSLPTLVGCLGGVALSSLPDGPLEPLQAAAALTALYGVAVVVGAVLDPRTRRATAVAAGACAVAAVLVLSAEQEWTALVVHLAVQGAFTVAWAWQTGRQPAARAGFAKPSAAPWRVAAAQFVGAAWVAAGAADVRLVEAYTLPAAAGLLLAAGPRLLRGRSWPAWAPGLLVAAAPSTLLAIMGADGDRPVWVLAGAAIAMVAGAVEEVRAPLLVGAGTALALTVGVVVRQLPVPLGAALVVGSLLLAVGAVREQLPVAAFGRRLADLR